ncbi:TipAS antibiotic-recognition domain-containing protein (plasmid) [Kocuria rhizophila]|nr:TipAS antibiotic-recognition domain-containing protein [Kocuria rhizophila]
MFEQSNRWWHAKYLTQQRQFQADAEQQLLAGWGELHQSGVSPSSDQAQQHAATHASWFAQIPGTPQNAGDLNKTRALHRHGQPLPTTTPPTQLPPRVRRTASAVAARIAPLRPEP